MSYQLICFSPPIIKFVWSHWGELNPRPSPYQGDAIPLSHSGSAALSGVACIIVAGVHRPSHPANVMVKTEGRLGLPSRGRIARYCAGLESPWDLSLASSNLALGAKQITETGAILVNC